MQDFSRTSRQKPCPDGQSGIRRLALCLRFSPAQSQSSSISQTIKATCSFLQMTYCFRSDFGIFFGILKAKAALQLSVMPFSAVRGGFEPPVRLPVRQFSKLVVSATHPSHQNCPVSLTGLQRYK